MTRVAPFGSPFSRLAGPLARLAGPLLLAPLLLTAAPRSPLAHDAGYYGLQARWILRSGQWLAPLWFGEPVYDRSIGVQWLMALSLKLFPWPWAEALPALLAAVVSLLLSGWLARRLLPQLPAAGPLTMALLALTPLWLNYAHLATQDMPLLAVELVGIAALVNCGPKCCDPGRGVAASRPAGAQPDGDQPAAVSPALPLSALPLSALPLSVWPSPVWPSPVWPLLVGLAPGLAFLIKGFMVALPILAIAPYLLLERRQLLRRGAFWLGLALGWLPVALWLALSLHSHGLELVGGLWQKLLFLSRADVYAAGPFYYLWNIPANTAPCILAALLGWPIAWRLPLERGQRLLLLLYPLLLLLLLSLFRTKTPYYGLQLTPWIAMAASLGLQRWCQVDRPWRRPLQLALGALATALLLAATLLLAALVWPAAPLQKQLAAAEGLPAPALLALAAAGLGACWLASCLMQKPRRRLLALLAGPWLALALLTQAGLFSDRSPALRQALAPPAVQSLLAQRPIQAAAAAPLNGDDHAQLILLALATPNTPDQLLSPAAVAPGQRLWLRRSELPAGKDWRVLLEAPALRGWVLAERAERAERAEGAEAEGRRSNSSPSSSSPSNSSP
jgi:4-amino-4-deoxy-L-arabinose transferase-like glycosyltransferase